MASAPASPLLRAWYSDARWVRWLAPLAWLFERLANRRRMAYLTGAREPWRAPVPVVVVGNIAVGGTGKTPLVAWLACWLKERGFHPGIVSRGHGGSTRARPLGVSPDADPDRVGDEAPLLAARTGCPVVVGVDRPRAVAALLEGAECDVVIADDGLQHYALARDVEIAVVDGARGLGNGRCLPAGPLREAPRRLEEVDLVVVNGEAAESPGQPRGLAGHCRMTLVPRAFVRVSTGERMDVAGFVSRHADVHAVAGIGNPERFADTLSRLGLQALLHAYPDHHHFDGDEVLFDDGLPVVCTEKDAVKLRGLTGMPKDLWYLEVDAALSDDDCARVADTLRKHGIVRT